MSYNNKKHLLMLVVFILLYTLNNTNSQSYTMIVLNISHDILPPAELPSYNVKLTSLETGIVQLIENKQLVAPGEYYLDIQQPGYIFTESKQKIIVTPEANELCIKAILIAKPRLIDFETTIEERFYKIFADSREISSLNDYYQVGREYNFVLIYHNWQPINKKVVIPPGEGRYIIKVANFEKAIKFYFGIYRYDTHKNWDGISYKYEFFIDEKKLEDFFIHIVAESKMGLYGYFIVPVIPKYYKIYYAFYYENVLLTSSILEKNLNEKTGFFVTLSHVDASKLIEHLQKVSPDKAIGRLKDLLDNKKDRAMIASLNAYDIEKMIEFLNSLNNNIESKDKVNSQLLEILKNRNLGNK